MISILILIDQILGLYTYIVIASVILSWLIAFEILNPQQRFVVMVWRALVGLTEPLLRPIRGIMPDLGGLDISPVILLLGLFFVRNFMWEAAAWAGILAR